MGPLCPISIHGGPVALLKFQMAPRLILLMSSGSKKKEPRYSFLSEAKASHSQRMWVEVSFSAAHRAIGYIVHGLNTDTTTERDTVILLLALTISEIAQDR